MKAAFEYWAVIPATGTGQRMQRDKPKQYLALGDKTIIEKTLDNLLSHPAIKGAVLVLNKHDQHWHQLNYQHDKPILICEGGEERHHSVLNGLKALAKSVSMDQTVVLIHDAVRPFVLHKDLDRLLDEVNKSDDGALLAAPVADTLKLADDSSKVITTQPRESLWRAFTPQAFRLDLIMNSLQSVIENNLHVTDDASAMELAGYRPGLVNSDSRNIKITQPEDLELAELLLAETTSGF